MTYENFKKKFNDSNEIISKSRKTTESNKISDEQSQQSMISLDSDIDEKTKNIVEKMIQNDQQRQEIQQEDIFKRKNNSPQFIEETGEPFINGKKLLENLIKENSNPKSSQKYLNSSIFSHPKSSSSSIKNSSPEGLLSLHSLIKQESLDQINMQDRVKNISLIEFNENHSFDPSESSNSISSIFHFLLK